MVNESHYVLNLGLHCDQEDVKVFNQLLSNECVMSQNGIIIFM